MASISYQIGDPVYAAEKTFNDGCTPHAGKEGDLIAADGSRRATVGNGVASMNDGLRLALVRFGSGPDAILGKSVGWLPKGLTQDQPLAA